MVTAVLQLTGMALSLIVAGFGYCHGSHKGKAVFGLGVVVAVGLLVLVTAVYTSQPGPPLSNLDYLDRG